MSRIASSRLSFRRNISLVHLNLRAGHLSISIRQASSDSRQNPQMHQPDTQGTSETTRSTTALPLPTSTSDPGHHRRTLDVRGQGTTMKLDHLGPLVVNQDGTLSRIANWAEMTEGERDNTLRVLGKRNQARLRALQSPNDSTGP